MKKKKAVSVKIEAEALKKLKEGCAQRGVSLTWALSRMAENPAVWPWIG